MLFGYLVATVAKKLKNLYNVKVPSNVSFFSEKIHFSTNRRHPLIHPKRSLLREWFSDPGDDHDHFHYNAFE